MGLKATVKGKIYESVEARISYEDLYKKTWFAQNKADVLVRPNLKGQVKTIDRAERRKKVEKILSKNGMLVNRYLDRKMNVAEIADEMMVSESFVRNIIKKYQLPL
jgi:hypothetical protein